MDLQTKCKAAAIEVRTFFEAVASNFHSGSKAGATNLKATPRPVALGFRTKSRAGAMKCKTKYNLEVLIPHKKT